MLQCVGFDAGISDATVRHANCLTSAIPCGNCASFLNCQFCTSQSTVLVARSIQELCELMTDLPDYASYFVNMICKILQDYLDSCQHAYHGIHCC